MFPRLRLGSPAEKLEIPVVSGWTYRRYRESRDSDLVNSVFPNSNGKFDFLNSGHVERINSTSARAPMVTNRDAHFRDVRAARRASFDTTNEKNNVR